MRSTVIHKQYLLPCCNEKIVWKNTEKNKLSEGPPPPSISNGSSLNGIAAV